MSAVPATLCFTRLHPCFAAQAGPVDMRYLMEFP
jgi:hypothetical protein